LTKSGVAIDLLAENATTLVSERPWSPATVLPVSHSWPRLLLQGGFETFRMGRRLRAPRSKSERIPPVQALRYLGLAVNYQGFLRKAAASLLHIHNPRHAQMICRQVLRNELPAVVTVHSVNLLEEPSPEWKRAMVRANYRRASRFIAVSSFVRERMVCHGAPADRITVIPNGVDGGEFAPGNAESARGRLELPCGGPLVLFAGNLVPRKGVDHLLDAFAGSTARDNGTLVIVGDGEEKKKLERRAVDLGISGETRFVGQRPPPEMPLWYRACDVFTMPSSAEGLSISVLEAMASERPVITTKSGVGEHDAVFDGENGCLVGFGDADALRVALDSLTGDPDRARDMGRCGRRLAIRRFEWQVIADRTVEVYKAAIRDG
jgi:glycosyltransferase involved in cell wall biosynthesis